MKHVFKDKEAAIKARLEGELKYLPHVYGDNSSYHTRAANGLKTKGK